MIANSQWSVVYDSIDGSDLVVIGSEDRDKPKLPGAMTLGRNFASAVAAYIWSGKKDRTPEQFEQCLKICSLCRYRRGANCSDCGCVITERAAMAAMNCPRLKW